MNRKIRTEIVKIELNEGTYEGTYHEKIIEPTLINFFYGRNGSGKSTLARAIFEKRGLTWKDQNDNIPVMIFDEMYVNEILKNYDKMPGVFTLGEDEKVRAKSITRSVSSESGEATDRAYEIFMKAFEQFRQFQADNFTKIPIRLIGISLQNLSFSGSRQLTFADVYENREEQMRERWNSALLNLERKYRMKITAERRVDLYETIGIMESFVKNHFV